MDRTALPFFRDTWVEVDLDAISSNVSSLARFYKSQGHDVAIMAVVKANAYGHGAIAVAKEALAAGATFLGVALLDEALELRKAGIQAPILVLGKTRPENAELARSERISVTVFEQEWLEEATRFLAKTRNDPLRIHVKMDTGMGRLGQQTVEKTIAVVCAAQKIGVVEGLFTHFATADELDHTYYRKQQERFAACVDKLEEARVSIPFIHTGNSAASMRYPGDMYNMVRFGISMYGLTPSLEIKQVLPFKLTPALSLKTKTVFTKLIQKGDAVSYGATYQAEAPTWIATLPIGYADGWARQNSTKGGYALVNGQKARFAGRICMDQCMIELSEPVPNGTTVTLVGKDAQEKIELDDVAKRLDTINYEAACMLNPRLPRIYVKNGKYQSVQIESRVMHKIEEQGKNDQQNG